MLEPALCFIGIGFHDGPHGFQRESRGVKRLDDSIVQITAQLHPFLQRTTQPLFALLQCLLGLFAFRDVPGDAAHARRAGQLLQPQIHTQHDATAVFGPHLDLAMSVDQPVLETFKNLTKPILMSGRDQLREVQPDRLLAQITKDLFARFVQ